MPKPSQLTPQEIAAAFDNPRWAEQFPPTMTLQQFARMFQVSVRTAKSWIANGDFPGATTRTGKHRRIWRDRALQIAFGRARTRPRAKNPTPTRSTSDSGTPQS